MSKRSQHPRLGRIRALAARSAIVAAGLAPAAAVVAQPVTTVDFAAGIACPTFDLRLQFTGFTEFRAFVDRAGNLVRLLNAGKDLTYEFINLQTGKHLTVPGRGTSWTITFNPDGTQRWEQSGHNVLFFFPTDVPPGPSTRVYIGRVVYDFDGPTQFSRVHQVSGRQIDICAALAN